MDWITSGATMNGPMPTMSIMLSAVAGSRPSPRSSDWLDDWPDAWPEFVGSLFDLSLKGGVFSRKNEWVA
jgi:hypothetical protein